MKKTLGIVLVCATLFSCQKDAVIQEEPSLTGETTVKGALTNTDWVLKHTALIYSPDLADNSEGEPCKKDEIYRYKLNGDTDIQFGNVNCGSSRSEISGSYGSWQLQANGTVLKQIVTRDVPGFINGETIYWTIDYITATKMRIKRLVTEQLGQLSKTYTQIDTYIRM
jgi:hypothetical protein